MRTPNLEKLREELQGEKYTIECGCGKHVPQKYFVYRRRKKGERPEGRCYWCSRKEATKKYLRLASEEVRKRIRAGRRQWEKSPNGKAHHARLYERLKADPERYRAMRDKDNANRRAARKRKAGASS